MPSEADAILALAFELSRILRQKTVAARKEENEISLLQLRTLDHLRRNDGVNMTKFADYLLVTFPSATKFANRLVRMGWVKRVSDPINQKIVRLQLTLEGKHILEEKLESRKEIIKPMLDKLSQQDQKHLTRILRMLLEQERGR